MSQNYQYIVKCEFCGKQHDKYGMSKEQDWTTFHESIRSIREKGFTYDYCESNVCQNRITKQSLIAYDSKTKE